MSLSQPTNPSATAGNGASLAASSHGATLQFQPFASAVDASFWHTLSQSKIDRFKLDDSPVQLKAYYSTGQRVAVNSYALGKQKESNSPSSTGSTAGTTSLDQPEEQILPSRIFLDANAFDDDER